MQITEARLGKLKKILTHSYLRNVCPVEKLVLLKTLKSYENIFLFVASENAIVIFLVTRMNSNWY